MELYEHQKKFIEQNPDRSLLCWDTGTGKTLTSIEWSKLKRTPGKHGFAIVPKALKANWQRNVPNWIIVYTKEEFKKLWKDLSKPEFIIVDEAHYFAGTKSAFSKILTAFIRLHQIRYVLLLTATPYRSSPWDIYVLARHLGYDWSWIKWRDTFFEEVYVGKGGFTFRSKQEGGTVKGKRIIRMKEGQEEKDKLIRIISNIGSIVSIHECADVPDQIDEVELFEITDAQKNKKVEAYDASPIVRYTKYHQIENGVLKSDGYTPDLVDIACLKNERLIELCKDNKKIIIVCRYNLQIDFLKEYLKGLNEILVIRGDVKDRDEVVQKAEASESAIVLIQAACSEGYELPSFPLMVFASMDYSYVNYKQMRGRILRLNKLKKNVYLHLVSKGIDTSVYNAIMRKQDFSLAMYANENTDNKEEEILGERFSN